MAKHYDAIVIGGGHNGLVTGGYLAKAGLKTVVLERRHVLGGCAVTEEIVPGYRFSVCSYIVSLLRPEIIRHLDLTRHGLEIVPLPSTFCPLPDGRYILRTDDSAETYRHLCTFSQRDAEMMPRFSRQMVKICRFVRPFLSMVPPQVESWNPAELLKLMQVGKRFRELEPDVMVDVIKLFTMSAVDYLKEWFENENLIAAMSVSGIIGTFLGVSSPGTAYVLLHHYMGEIDGVYRAWGLPKDGTGGISMAIARAAQHNGCEIRTEASVKRMLVHNGQVEGVVLENGEELRAKIVASSLDPNMTFNRLVGKENLEAGFLDGLGTYKYRGSSGKVNLAVDKLPEFKCLPGLGKHMMGDISIAPSIDYLEQAYDDAKYGRFSRKPFINVVVPSVIDPDVSPPGKHVVSCFVQYAPYKLSEGHWDDQREAFGDAVVDTLAEYIPNLKSSIVGRQVLTPLDLERDFGLTEGNIFHGELSLEQMFFFRPVPAWAHYRTPVKRLYMCGSGVHPGGGVMGAPGAIAAQEILRDRKSMRNGEVVKA
ncbi:MAG: NAD(P)/FAD-dependent oxidoreductase [Candidatus Eremiobacteraeota bacterium]|nr:NAD(P)/FAD-dependent oxidoreductase [Candidatus Eremiobacteraeota bacterium]